MDQVVAGFEKQLDKLLQDDALDIAADVEVLENMLKDGLSDGKGHHTEVKRKHPRFTIEPRGPFCREGGWF